MDAGVFNRLGQSNEGLDDLDLELLKNLRDEDCVVFNGRVFSVRMQEAHGLISLSVFPFDGRRLIYFPEIACSYNIEQGCFLYSPFPDISYLKAFLNGYSFMS